MTVAERTYIEKDSHNDLDWLSDWGAAWCVETDYARDLRLARKVRHRKYLKLVKARHLKAVGLLLVHFFETGNTPQIHPSGDISEA